MSAQSRDINVLIQEFLQTRHQRCDLEEREMELLHALKEFSGPPDLNLMIFYVGDRGRFATWIPGIPFFVNNESSPALSTGNDDDLESVLSYLEGIIHPEDFPPLAHNIREFWNGRTPTLYGRHRVAWVGLTTIWLEVHIMAIKRDQKGIPIECVGCVRFPGRPPRGSLINQLSINLSEFFGSMNEENSPLAALFEFGDENKADLAKEVRDLVFLVQGVGIAEAMGSTESWNLSFVKDRSMRYVWVSGPLAQMLGLSLHEMQGRSDYELFHAADEAEEARIGEAVARGVTGRLQRTRIVAGTRQIFWDSLWPVPQGSGGEARWILGVSSLVDPRETAIDTGRSPAMVKVLDDAARSESIALLTGESGSGKDYLAKYIHDNSKRANGPFFSINCAAIPGEMAESELFGHERGAYTGAHTRKRGLLELAEGGTLLLNEIGELSPPVQAKLLTFLDTKKFTRVGGEKEIKVNARLIAATNKDLEEEVSQGRFRKDLYYRLNVIKIEIPPLRERPQDLPGITTDLLRELCTAMRLTEVPEIDDQDMEILLSYQWPGNIRELRTVLERALLFSSEGKLSLWQAMPKHAIKPDDLQKEASPQRTSEDNWPLLVRFRKGPSDPDLFKETHRSLIEEAMRRANGVKAQAARLLGVTDSQLKTKLSTLGITGPK